MRGRSAVSALLICVALTAVIALLPAAAAARAELTISPLILNVSGKPGETITEPITVTASGDEALVVEFQHADFGFDDATYAVRIIEDSAEDTTRFSTRGWFSVDHSSYRVAAGTSITIPLHISIPKNATSGTHLGAGFFRTVTKPAHQQAASVTTSARTGPLVFVDVSGGSDPKPDLTTFTVDRLRSRGPITAKAVINNRGDRYFTYSGTLRLTGHGIDDKLVIPEKYVVPRQPRTVRATDDARLTFDKRSLRFGRYDVHLKLKIDPTGTTIDAHRTVWIIPRWAWIVGIAWLVALIIATTVITRMISIRRRSRRTVVGEDDSNVIDADPSDDADEFI